MKPAHNAAIIDLFNPLIADAGNQQGATRMLDVKPQPSLPAAITEMMWACAFSAARVGTASTARGVTFWLQMLCCPIGRPAWANGPAMFPLADDAPSPAEGSRSSPPMPSPAEAPEADVAFASYRSAGGHAAAQVVMPR